MPQNVLIPTEIINRELDFQLGLAAQLQARPRRELLRIFIGKESALRVLLPHLRGGVYIGRCFLPLFPGADLSFYRQLKARDFSFVHLDEEGAIYEYEEPNWRRSLLRRLDPNVLDPASDYICTWGDYQKAVYAERAPGFAHRIRTTGHPRFDLYAPAMRSFFHAQVEALRQQYGRFIIVNTNTSLANHGAGVESVFTELEGYPDHDPVLRALHLESWSLAHELMTRLVKLVHRLSVEFPNVRIVLRPHPSENKATYRAIFDCVQNVDVIHEGAVGPWLMASRALIHHGCTTAVEAQLAGVPVVNYRLPNAQKVWIYLPDQLGTHCDSEDEAVSLIRRALSDEGLQNPAPTDPTALDLFANFQQPGYPRFLDVVQEALAESGAGHTFDRRAWRLRAGADAWLESGKNIVRRLSPRRRRIYADVRNRFWGFSNADLQDRWGRICRLLDTECKLVVHSSRLLEIEAPVTTPVRRPAQPTPTPNPSPPSPPSPPGATHV